VILWLVTRLPYGWTWLVVQRIDMKGAKEIPIKTTGNEKCKMTVMLSAKAGGTKLRPYIIINRVRRIDGLSKLKNKLHIIDEEHQVHLILFEK